MAWKTLFFAFFSFISWPSFVLLLPLYVSFSTMETQSHSKNQQCLSFWVLFALSATFPKTLLWLPYVKGILTFFLVMPYFWGASYLYNCSLRPYLVKGSHNFFLIWNIVFLLVRKCLSLSLCRQNNLAVNVCQPHYERDRKPISNKVQKEHLRVEQYKAKYKYRKDAVALVIRWKKPEVGWVKLNTDGSIDGEKAGAGLGGLLRNYKGDPICGFVSKVNLDDIFLVELYAIWKGLVVAQELGVKVVWVESDSMSAVKTINRRKQFHNGKADKYLEHIWSLLNKFDRQQVTHSWRETNRAADYLSKMVFQTHDVLLWPCHFPLTLHNIIQDDAQGRIYVRR